MMMSLAVLGPMPETFAKSRVILGSDSGCHLPGAQRGEHTNGRFRANAGHSAKQVEYLELVRFDEAEKGEIVFSHNECGANRRLRADPQRERMLGRDGDGEADSPDLDHCAGAGHAKYRSAHRGDHDPSLRLGGDFAADRSAASHVSCALVRDPPGLATAAPRFQA